MKRLKKILVWISVSVGFIIAVLLLVWAIMNAIWGAELRKTIAEMKARGEPMTIAEIIPPYVPPEKNAAIEFHKVFALMCGDKPDERYIPFKQGKLKPDLEKVEDYFRKKIRTQVSEEDTKKILELVDSPEFTEIFDALNAVAVKPECNFDIRYENGINTIFPRLGIARAAIRLSSLKALTQANKGNITGACDTLMMAVKVSNHFQSEPNLVSQLVRMACLRITADVLNNIADNFQIPEENSKKLIAELEKINTTEPLKKTFIEQRLCNQTVCDELISGKHGYDYFNNSMGVSDNSIGPRLAYSISKIFIKKDYCECLRIMTAYSDICDKPYYLSKEMEIKNIETYFDNISCFHSVFFLLLTPNLTEIFENNAELQAKLAISKIKLALNIYKGKHAAFPENLEQLKPDILREIPIDELTGTPLTYKKEGEKYVLFSAAVQKLEEEHQREREADREKDSKK